jgi:hypothetical protein
MSRHSGLISARHPTCLGWCAPAINSTRKCYQGANKQNKYYQCADLRWHKGVRNEGSGSSRARREVAWMAGGADGAGWGNHTQHRTHGRPTAIPKNPAANIFSVKVSCTPGDCPQFRRALGPNKWKYPNEKEEHG